MRLMTGMGVEWIIINWKNKKKAEIPSFFPSLENRKKAHQHNKHSLSSSSFSSSLFVVLFFTHSHTHTTQTFFLSFIYMVAWVVAIEISFFLSAFSSSLFSSLGRRSLPLSQFIICRLIKFSVQDYGPEPRRLRGVVVVVFYFKLPNKSGYCSVVREWVCMAHTFSLFLIDPARHGR